MATTYNNLYMDIRQELHCAGIDAATLEARELVAFAAGKTRQELLRDGRLYVPQEVERRAREHGAEHLDLISVNDEHHIHFYTFFGMYQADNLKIMGKHFSS